MARNFVMLPFPAITEAGTHLEAMLNQETGNQKLQQVPPAA
jgi:hypothetical protein